jgi:GTP-binding protein HflX
MAERFFKTNGERPERALLAAVSHPRQPRWEVTESLDELHRLADSAGACVVGRVVQEREAASPSLHFGRGKVEEMGVLARELGATLLISDNDLTPVQERNLGKALGIKVVDRTALILDIFAQRARTSEGKLQVELAQLSYLLPRLVGQWKHLERLGGGIGTRGPGETQLESDRRVVRRRIRQIQEELGSVQVHRRLLRDRRRVVGLPVVALVGYTNAGKTTLFNRLAGAAFESADRLFMTLDPAARLVSPPDRQPFILTDTVGFIRKLPVELVTAFKATLEELSEANLLLHVVDGSHPRAAEQRAAVERLLGELGLDARPTILVLNKVDRIDDQNDLRRLVQDADGVLISARTGAGMNDLLARIHVATRHLVSRLSLTIPYGDGGALSLCYERGRVLHREDRGEGIFLEVELPLSQIGAVSAYESPRSPSASSLPLEG